MIKKQRKIIGALFAIKLGDGRVAFGQDVNSEESIFYDYLTNNVSAQSIAEAYDSNVAFRVCVVDYAVKSGRWEIVDKTHTVGSDLALPKKYFMQDQLNGKFSIYEHGKITPATKEDCIGLERCASWEPQHVEGRLRDYFDGKPNIWVEQLRLK